MRYQIKKLYIKKQNVITYEDAILHQIVVPPLPTHYQLYVTISKNILWGLACILLYYTVFPA
jgi:hypothetical protein